MKFMDAVDAVERIKNMKMIKRLLDACNNQGPDIWGFINYIPKDFVDDATTEYREITKAHAQRATPKRVRTSSA